MDLVNQRLGSWHIRELLGNGGQGAVWLGVKQNIDGSQVKSAIKTLYGSAVTNPEKQRMLAHEHDMLRGLNSPYVARYLDSGVERVAVKGGQEPIQWIALEMIPGQSLAEEVNSAGILDEYAWLELAHDALAGLSAIHSKGIIHSDIKPANIMRSSRKSLIVDLGAASLAGIRDLGDQSPVSTVEFAAPEQFDAQVDAKDYGYEVDIFSLGMTLVFAATGAPAWDEVYRDQRSVNKQSVRAHYEAMRDKAPRLTGLSVKQKELVTKMLQFNPNQRVPAATLLQQVKDLLPEGSARNQEQVSEEPVRWIAQTSANAASTSRVHGNQGESEPKWGMSILLAIFGYGIGQALRLVHFNSNEIWRYSSRRAEYIFVASLAHIFTFGLMTWFTARQWKGLGAGDWYPKITLASAGASAIYVIGLVIYSVLDPLSPVANVSLAISAIGGLCFFGASIYVAVPPKKALSS